MTSDHAVMEGQVLLGVPKNNLLHVRAVKHIHGGTAPCQAVFQAPGQSSEKEIAVLMEFIVEERVTQLRHY